MTSPNKNEDKNNKEILLEAYRLVEQNLQSQVDVALAADQKAATFCGLVVAALAALIGFSDVENFHWSLRVSSALFAVSAVFSVLALRPVKFFVRGLPFGNFKDDIDENRPYLDVLREYAGMLDDCLEKNDVQMRKNSNLFRVSIYAALLGLVFLILTSAIYPLLELAFGGSN